MKLKILKTDDEYKEALARVDSRMNALPNSPEEEELELWALLVDRYESDRFAIEIPDPIEAIKFRMEQEGLRQKDPVKCLPGRASSPKS